MIDPRYLFSAVARLMGAKGPDKIKRKVDCEMIEKNARVPASRVAKYQIGQVVRHRMFDFRGLIFDVDPEFSNTEEWYQSIPEEVRPAKNQPYYHLFAENERTHYVAYVSEQNLVPDESDDLIRHPDIPELFEMTDEGGYILKPGVAN